jgi:hypothetical protein
MSYHPKQVADFGTSHGFDLTSASDRKELAAEYVKANKAPSGLAASTIEWHLEAFLKGESVGLYEPDGTTRKPDDRDSLPIMITPDALLDLLTQAAQIGRNEPAAQRAQTRGEITDLVRRLMPTERSGSFAIKVDGEEIDHADTRATAERARNTIIYGEIGTEGNTTIEPRTPESRTP